MFIVNRDVATTNGTSRIVIVPKASGTPNHRSYGHITILTMMTWFLGLLLNDSFLVRLVFFSPETISKVDDIKITSKVSAFFPPLHVYLPFVTLLLLLFARF